MKIKNVTVCGAGVLGKQIAFQTAFYKFNVVLYDINIEILEKAKTALKSIGKTYQIEVNATQQDVDLSLSNITFATHLTEATKDADLIIEAIPESIKLKKAFYIQLGKVAPSKSIFCTNSSTLLPSIFAKDTGRPTRFLALHFANKIWKYNTAEIMGHATTDPKIFNLIIDFAKAIGMMALPIYKEQPGYILNSLLIPFLKSALSLYANGVADPATIDKTWMKASGAPMGPFGICDIVSITTVYNIKKLDADAEDTDTQKVLTILQENFIDQGKLGVPTGEGFYTYPNPEYENPDFLKE